ncbi:MAG: glycosyltransferase [Flavobacterium psychrophilum]
MASAPHKIAIVTTSLAQGGAERVAANLSVMFSQLGVEVHLISINNAIDYAYAGQLYNLGIEVKQRGWLRRIYKAIKLKQYLQSQQISLVIDNRTRPVFWKEVIYSWVYQNRRLIYLIHSFKLENYLPKSPHLAHFLYSKNTQFVAVSLAIAKEIKRKYGFKKVQTIYNSIPELPAKMPADSTTEKPYILFFGRLNNAVKNINLLLETFKLSGIHQQGVLLKIMGDGPDKIAISSYINQLQLDEYVELMPFEQAPFAVIQHAKFTVLTSHYEGFPMSIVESLALGVPVVSVDCLSGPSELIQSGENGILVPNHNVQALADALHELNTNEALYENCKKNAQKSIEHLSLDSICSAWNNLLQTSYEKHD